MEIENEIIGNDIRTIFERNKCDPKKFNMTYCIDYKKDICPGTCDYANEKNKDE